VLDRVSYVKVTAGSYSASEADHSHKVPVSRKHDSICLHGVVLNELIAGSNSRLTFLLIRPPISNDSSVGKATS
jgi:hypothetical protein